MVHGITQDLDGRRRVVIESVSPKIDGGAFPIKRVVGEAVRVSVDAFTDGYDAIATVLRYRHETEAGWTEVPMQLLQNDRWQAEFSVLETGRYRYTVSAWIERFVTWVRDFKKRVAAQQDVGVDLLIGAALIEEAASRAMGADAGALTTWVRLMREQPDRAKLLPLWDDAGLLTLMHRNADRRYATQCACELEVIVDRERARFGAWYEFFPRSTADEPGRHGTFADCERRLSYVSEMGFDVIYLPPIHPIGRTFRKGRNNAVTAGPNDPGSPWAIGAAEGGHKSIHPELGTLDDFRRFVQRAAGLGIEVALDIALQCAPDHPYVESHRSWFRARPDGTIQYAENPPKKYQDIYPFDFETEDWRAMWVELKSIFEFWIEQGVKIFRVDNPHTKAFGFWQWAITEIKRSHPDVIFLAEAFTRPKVMYRLAKLGFTQSYNYFPWRNTKRELTGWFTELNESGVREFFRPNLWPNTPDILTEHLQLGGRPAFMSRFVLAATLGTSYGIYGPAFEHCHNVPRNSGGEEYLDSEKYQLQHHDLNRSDSLRGLFARMNKIRRENPALQSDEQIQFHEIDNEELICFSKRTPDQTNLIVVVVNLDPHHVRSGWIELPLRELGIPEEQPFQVHDLLTDARYLWHGPRNYVEVNPRDLPAHVFRIRQRVRSEADFEYFL
jgi:starch synthase (maltosyl-transferring)